MDLLGVALVGIGAVIYVFARRKRLGCGLVVLGGLIVGAAVLLSVRVG